jgi:ArsR family transcriptional regulator, arsenate/arsenite/antimonite-responsive transcriptional repressor
MKPDPSRLITIYDCFCDLTRLRLLHLLKSGPLCVCHFQEVLKEPQVKISKHLGYLRTRGLVEARREGQWMIYSLAAKPTRELTANLACLQDCVGEEPVFQKDAERLQKLREKIKHDSAACCPSKPIKLKSS